MVAMKKTEMPDVGPDGNASASDTREVVDSYVAENEQMVAEALVFNPATLGWHDARYPYKVTLSRVIPELTAFDGNFPTHVEFTPQGQYELTYKVILSPEDFAKVVAE